MIKSLKHGRGCVARHIGLVSPYLHLGLGPCANLEIPGQYAWQRDGCHVLLYPPQTLFVVGILFSRCPSVRASIRPCVLPSVTLCFLNILKSHGWIFIKPCKHVHICKTNTLNKKVRARGQFY